MATASLAKTSFKAAWTAWAIGLLIAATASSAPAQAPPPEKRLDELEKQVQMLRQTVDELRGDQQPAGNPLARIREEGLRRSQVMQTLSYLTDVIGPRLTGSPELQRANQWARDRLSSWGLADAHLEAWGPFGRGWSLRRFSAQIVEPHPFPLVAYPKAWSPGFERPIVADVVYLDVQTEGDLEKYKGHLKGAIVLTGMVRELEAHFEPLARRRTAADLEQLADAEPGRPSAPPRDPNAASGSAVRGSATPAGQLSAARTVSFLTAEGAALVVEPSMLGDFGTIFVAAASVPAADVPPGNGEKHAALRPWSSDAPAMPAQITLATETFNHLVRMIRQGEKLKMAVELQVEFCCGDRMAYNTIAEIPGSDLKDEIVMLGGHLDSWHAGTGATDNAAGVAAAMEAVRIVTALKLRPRRTIRIGLWSGEEQGLLGSKAYVAKHFGTYADDQNARAAGASKDQNAPGRASESAGESPQSQRKLLRQPEYDKFSVYFNLDNGGGRIRGIYLQSNEAARPIFRRWLGPFRDLDAETVSLANSGGTDHQPFDAIGLPGFQFIQDPIEYKRTHHSNADVFERVQADDLKQAAIIMAAFAYDAAMMDEKLPRKSAK